VEVREKRQVLTEPRIFDRDRLLDLEEQLGSGPDVVDRRDRRTRALVRLVGKGAAHARARLDQDVVPLQ
jgi:hypothetical protein